MIASETDWNARTHAAQYKKYRLHCLTYGKLMQRDDPFGKIVGRTEHQRTAQTIGFPKDLLGFCSQSVLIPGWNGVTSTIRKPWQDTGAFVMRTVTTAEGKSYYMFCKIAAWSEDASKPTARVFTHMNLWCIEADGFDLLVALPIIHYLFWPNNKRPYYNLTLPATESMESRLAHPILELDFSNAIGYWEPMSRVLRSRKYKSDGLDTLNKLARSGDQSKTISEEAFFLLADLKVWENNIQLGVDISVGIAPVPTHLENPFSRQFFGECVPLLRNKNDTHAVD
jgi:hypothetical protein